MRKRLAPLAGAIAGAGLLLFAAAPPVLAQAAVTCSGPDPNEPWEQGTLSDDGSSWEPGSDSTDTHYRVSCTSDTEGDAVDPETDLPKPLPGGATRLIVHFADEKADSFENTALETGSEHWVLTGDLGGSAKSGAGIEVRTFTSDSDVLVVESFATIDVRADGKPGIDLKNDDAAHSGRIEAINRGSITSTGDNQAHGISVLSRSQQSGAEAKAVNTGTVATTINARGAVGVRARVVKNGAGTATVVNEGTVTTRGSTRVYGGNIYFSEGLRADSLGGGNAQATNKAGASVETHSPGAIGMAARALNQRGEAGEVSGDATAENSGSVTTQRNSYLYADRSAWVSTAGIFARSTDGKALVTSLASGTVDTHGEAAYGLFARSNKGKAQVRNFGEVTTHADTANVDVTLPEGDAPTGALGVFAWSDIGDAIAENGAADNDAAAVTTAGPGAFGVMALNNNHGRTRKSTTRARNYGTVTTTGATADGIVAHALNGGTLTTRNAVQAYNEVSASVSTTGVGARGLVAIAGMIGSRGVATAENAGSITTWGNPHVDDNDEWVGAAGVFARSTDGTATAKNVAPASDSIGTVHTHGEAAYGLFARSDNGAAVAQNLGKVQTHATTANVALPEGDAPTGALGVFAWSDTGNATAENGAMDNKAAEVQTAGAGAVGLFALNNNEYASTVILARNYGTVTTTGANADGVVARALHGGRQDNPNAVQAYNEGDASISTEADGSGGMSASILVDAGGTAYGSASVENRGTITTTGGRGGSALDNAFGISAHYYNDPNDDPITRTGAVTAYNSGTITVSGPGARGIQAVTYGSGAATVTAEGGTVTASHDDTENDADDGVGIYASSGATDGSIAVNILDGAVIDAPQAMLLEGAPATVSVSGGSQVFGRVAFGNGAGTLTVTNGAWFEGAITGLEEFTGSGGWIGLGDVSFTGSSATFKDDAQATIYGTFDLGESGTMTIHDGSRVRLAAAMGRELPQIDAGGGIDCRDSGDMPTDCTLYVHNYEGAGATAGELVGNALSDRTKLLSGSEIHYATQTGDGEAVPVATATVNADMTQADPDFAEGSAASVPGPPPDAPRTPRRLASDDPPPTPGGPPGGGPSEEDPPGGGPSEEDPPGGGPSEEDPPSGPPAASPADPGGSSGGGGGSERGAVAGLGLLGLVFALIDFGPDEALAPALSKPAFIQAGGGGSHWWTRNLAEALPAGGPGSAEGVEIGMEAEVGNGFTLGFAAAPDMAAQQAAGAEAAAFSGSRYSLRGGWQGERLFAGLRLSHADWRVEGGWDNAAVGERMRSRFDAAHRDVRLSLGARLGLGGGAVLVPQADAFAGEVERGGHTAEGALFRAAMPAMTQRYSGVRAGLGFASDWQEAGRGLKLRPKLNLSAMRVQAESESFELRQSDRLGFLSTSSRARLAGGPETVFGLGAGLEAAGPGGLHLGLGYAGLVMDGKLTHAAAARLRLPF